MITIINDQINHRTITKDHVQQSISIVGDCSSSSITSYWVVNKFAPDSNPSVFITLDSAIFFADHRNKPYNFEVFIIIKRTIFV